MTMPEWGQFAPPLLAMLASGLLAGFMAGLFGIGGGFVVVPAIVAVLSSFSIGSGDGQHVMHVAVGTSLASIVMTSLRSVQAHARRGAVDFGILRAWSPWVVLGVLVGVGGASLLDGRSLRLIFAIGVFIMGLHFLVPVLGRRGPIRQGLPTGALRAGLGSFLGGLSALLGIGGGTPAVLIMTLSGVPMHRAVATAAGFGTVIAVPGVIGHILIGWHQQGLPVGSLGFVNVGGLVSITAASMLTAPMGVAVAHSLDAMRLKRAFGVYLLVTSALMLHGYFSS
jgi:uncharacterized protein